MEHYHLYHYSVPPFLQVFARTPAVQRLKQIGMNCGCEYTSFPLFGRLKPYSRYDHSFGVALIIWHFTQSCPQSVSGLLHDIATPVFAHVIDFMNDDYMKQDSTEAGTGKMIADSPELQECLERFGLANTDVCNYHRYPVADNNSPQLSADRLEYSLGNMLNYELCSIDVIKAIYDDLTVDHNEAGQDEIMFRTADTAEAFALMALKCSGIYVSDEDRYAMQILSEILQSALLRGIITTDDLYSTEPEIISKLRQDHLSASRWHDFCLLNRITRSGSKTATGNWRQIDAKRRCIDPMVKGRGRFSTLSPSFKQSLDSFLSTKLDYWISGTSCRPCQQLPDLFGSAQANIIG